MCLHQWYAAVKPEHCSTDTRSFPVATSKEEMTLSTPSGFNQALVSLQTAEGKRCHCGTRGIMTLANRGCWRTLRSSTQTLSFRTGTALGFYGWERKETVCMFRSTDFKVYWREDTVSSLPAGVALGSLLHKVIGFCSSSKLS